MIAGGARSGRSEDCHRPSLGWFRHSASVIHGGGHPCRGPLAFWPASRLVDGRERLGRGVFDGAVDVPRHTHEHGRRAQHPDERQLADSFGTRFTGFLVPNVVSVVECLALCAAWAAVALLWLSCHPCGALCLRAHADGDLCLLAVVRRLLRAAPQRHDDTTSCRQRTTCVGIGLHDGVRLVEVRQAAERQRDPRARAVVRSGTEVLFKEGAGSENMVLA